MRTIRKLRVAYTLIFLFWIGYLFHSFTFRGSIFHNSVPTEFENGNRWLLSEFMKQLQINETNYWLSPNTSKKRICLLNVDSRPLERFSSIQNFENMSFHSVVAYSNLFYGKHKFLILFVSSFIDVFNLKQCNMGTIISV